jgi:SAM-dependent methyltransferase
MSQAQPPSEEMRAEDWAGEMGERWLAHLDRFEGMIAPAGAALLQHAGVQAGERVLDVGCGGGATSRALAAAVGPAGSVLGLDISPVLVAEAGRRAAAAGLANLRFIAGDASTAQPEGAPFDRLLSRFGSMFFPDPAKAFANLASLVRPGGRADFAVWAPAKENPWVASLMGVLANHIELPAPPPPGTPGPFSLDDPARFGAILAGAGFRDASFTLWRGEQMIGGPGADAAAAADFVLSAMSFADMLEAHPPAVRAAVNDDLTSLFSRHETAAGVAMGANVWLVTAYR